MTNQYLLDRISGRDANLRAGDADRERIAERLRKSHAEGRLDLGEFQDRLEQTYQAKTLGELRELVRDLPRQDDQPQRSVSGWLGPWPRRLVPILIVLILFSAAIGHHHAALLWIPLVFLIWRMSWWRRRRWAAGGRRGPDDWM